MIDRSGAPRLVPVAGPPRAPAAVLGGPALYVGPSRRRQQVLQAQLDALDQGDAALTFLEDLDDPGDPV
jgi:hypothetical protein